jgi:hypothetical protein
MKLSVALTLEGMVRALRGKAHALADEAEDGYRRRRRTGKAELPRRSGAPRGEPRRRDADGRAGR